MIVTMFEDTPLAQPAEALLCPTRFDELNTRMARDAKQERCALFVTSNTFIQQSHAPAEGLMPGVQSCETILDLHQACHINTHSLHIYTPLVLLSASLTHTHTHSLPIYTPLVLWLHCFIHTAFPLTILCCALVAFVSHIIPSLASTPYLSTPALHPCRAM